MSDRRLITTAGVSLMINPVSAIGVQMLSGEYEPGTRHILQKYLSVGSTFIDLGANEGYFSIIASQIVGHSGEVIAIEPQYDCSRL